MSSWPQSSTLIPELLSVRPAARRVLDKYGLHGCGDPQGPVETLAFFARAHDVPLERLLAELRVAEVDLLQPMPTVASTARPIPAQLIPVNDASAIADAIYRPFFKAGIATVLTLGALWGSYLLLRIGLNGSFSSAGLHEINAHGHAQIFGWVGLFVMGFAYQAFPRFKHTTLVCPRLAVMTLSAMVIGTVGRSVSQPIVDTIPRIWSLAVAASVLEVAAIVTFAALILATWRRSSKGLAYYDYYILSALSWFVVQAIYESVYLTVTLFATGDELTDLVATWQAPLRDIQIHGFALLIILGVSQRIFRHFYALPQSSARRSLVVVPLLNIAVMGEAGGLILMRAAGRTWAGLWYASVILLAGCVLVLLKDWRIYSRAEDKDRSLKFLRAAYAWLLLSLAMLVLLPFYQFGLLRALAPEGEAAITGFSHAYYGATRHAVTVGFISLMIVGVAAKVVPTLNGISSRVLSSLWGPFVLINAGCALRVIGQTVTDFTAVAFPIAGISGVLEVTGLAMWGTHLWLVMAGRARIRRRANARTEADSLENRGILASDTPARVLEHFPDLLRTFDAHGFSALASPELRATIGRVVTIEQACRPRGVNTDEFLAELNRRRGDASDRRADLPLVSLETLTATFPTTRRDIGVNGSHGMESRHA
jgi:NnrS protein/Domain of unknown function (DUF1858)